MRRAFLNISGFAYLALAVFALAYLVVPDVLGLAAPGAALGFVVVKLPGFANVGVSQTAIANIPRGVSYRALFTGITDNAVDPTQAVITARYTRWVVKANGVIKIDLTGGQLQELNAYKGNADENGVRSIWFVDPKQATMMSEDAMLYGTANLDTFSLEVDIGAAAVGPILELHAMIDPRPMPLGVHRITQVLTEAPGGVNTAYQVLNMPPRIRGRYAEKIHFKASANAINAARLILNNQDIWAGKVKLAKSINGGSYFSFVWQTGYYHMDLTVTRRLSDALNLNVQDLRAELDVSGAMTLTSIWEMIDATMAPANALQALGMRT